MVSVAEASDFWARGTGGCNGFEKAFIGLGANLGDRVAALRGALSILAQNQGIRVLAYSGLYETEPVGVLEQPCFLNAVACVEPVLKPEQLLDELLRIEQIYGRERIIRWGPRTLDLDLLLYGEKQVQTSRLIVPHPRLFERAFVLVPLLELKQWLPASVVRRAQEALTICGADGVTKLEKKHWAGSFY